MTKSSLKKLRGNTAKELLRSLKTSIPIVKLASADAALREYMLYTLLSIANELNSTLWLPAGLRHRELSAAEWKDRGVDVG